VEDRVSTLLHSSEEVTDIEANEDSHWHTLGLHEQIR
jgi:hypothetical protein